MLHSATGLLSSGQNLIFNTIFLTHTAFTRSSAFAASFAGIAYLVFYARDTRKDQDGNWKLPGNKGVISDKDRWETLKKKNFIDWDTPNYFLDTCFGTKSDYKQVDYALEYNDNLAKGTRTFKKTECFAKGSGPMNWFDQNIVRHIPSVTTATTSCVAAVSLIRKIFINEEHKKDKKSNN